MHRNRDAGHEVPVLRPHIERRLARRDYVRLDVPSCFVVTLEVHEGELPRIAECAKRPVAAASNVRREAPADRVPFRGNSNVGNLIAVENLINASRPRRKKRH